MAGRKLRRRPRPTSQAHAQMLRTFDRARSAAAGLDEALGRGGGDTLRRDVALAIARCLEQHGVTHSPLSTLHSEEPDSTTAPRAGTRAGARGHSPLRSSA